MAELMPHWTSREETELGTEVTWDCPICQTPNVDIIELTALPLCESCGRAVDWDGVVVD